LGGLSSIGSTLVALSQIRGHVETARARVAGTFSKDDRHLRREEGLIRVVVVDYALATNRTIGQNLKRVKENPHSQNSSWEAALHADILQRALRVVPDSLNCVFDIVRGRTVRAFPKVAPAKQAQRKSVDASKRESAIKALLEIHQAHSNRAMDQPGHVVNVEPFH
jgi:hypothetical protein